MQTAWLLKAVTCIDLTTLAGDDTPSNVHRLCLKAIQPVRYDLLKKMDMHDKGLLPLLAFTVWTPVKLYQKWISKYIDIEIRWKLNEKNTLFIPKGNYTVAVFFFFNNHKLFIMERNLRKDFLPLSVSQQSWRNVTLITHLCINIRGWSVLSFMFINLCSIQIFNVVDLGCRVGRRWWRFWSVSQSI